MATNPMDLPDPSVDPYGLTEQVLARIPRPKCRATNRAGNPCGRYAIPGGMVCSTHGGKAPQVRDKARIRLIGMIEPALQVLSDVMADEKAAHADKLRAANSVLDRAGYARVAVLDIDAARDLLTQRILTIMENPETKP
jgi:hypothetical protein